MAKRYIIQVNVGSNCPLFATETHQKFSSDPFRYDTSFMPEQAHGYHYKREAEKEAEYWKHSRVVSYKDALKRVDASL